MADAIRCPECKSQNVECVEKPHHNHICHDCGNSTLGGKPEPLAVAVAALTLIDRHGCETFTSGRCLDENSGRTRGAEYGAERWCDPCVARDALNRIGGTDG
jgi:hypothetical protein